MNPDQYRAAAEQLGLTPLKAGLLFGVHRETIYLWQNGKTPVPKPVALVIALMGYWDITPDEAERALQEALKVLEPMPPRAPQSLK